MTTPKPDDRPAFVDLRVADAWREASNEEPSASVDDAILAAARREVSARPEALVAWKAREARTVRRRWWPLAAAATVAAVAVGVLQLTPTDTLVSPATETAAVSDVPVPAANPDAGAAAPPPAPSAQQSKEEKPARNDDARLEGEAPKIERRPRSAPAGAAPAAPAPPPTAPTTAAAPPAVAPAAPAEPRQQAAVASTPDPFPAAKKTTTDTAAAGGQVSPSMPTPPPAPPRAEAAANVAREGESVARQSAAPSPAAAPAPAAPLAKLAAVPAADSGVAESRVKDRKPLPVADWIALIRRLRADGKTDEAGKELAAFRAAHPDHEKLLPPDLRDWRPAER
jgi:hypothetical protein